MDAAIPKSSIPSRLRCEAVETEMIITPRHSKNYLRLLRVSYNMQPESSF